MGAPPFVRAIVASVLPSAGTLCLAGCPVGDDTNPEAIPRTQQVDEDVSDDDPPAAEELAYALTIVRGADGDVLDVAEEGTWSSQLAEAVARPWLHVADGVVYDEEAWHHENPDGTTEGGYRVMARPASLPTGSATPVPAEPITEALAAVLSNSESDTLLDVLIEMSEWSPAVMPWVPHRLSVSAEDYEAALTDMREAADQDDDEFAEFSAALASAIETAGGQVHSRIASVGAVAARLPLSKVEALALRPDVRRIDLDGPGPDATHSGDPVPLGDLKVLSGVQDYINAGEDGALCSPLCFGLLLGITESGGLQGRSLLSGQHRVLAFSTCFIAI